MGSHVICQCLHLLATGGGDQESEEITKGVVTNYGEGGATKREGGAREVLPLRKGGAEKVLAILKGGAQKVLG